MLSFYRVCLKSGIRGHMTINRIKYAELKCRLLVSMSGEIKLVLYLVAIVLVG